MADVTIRGGQIWTGDGKYIQILRDPKAPSPSLLGNSDVEFFEVQKIDGQWEKIPNFRYASKDRKWFNNTRAGYTLFEDVQGR